MGITVSVSNPEKSSSEGGGEKGSANAGLSLQLSQNGPQSTTHSPRSFHGNKSPGPGPPELSQRKSIRALRWSPDFLSFVLRGGRWRGLPAIQGKTPPQHRALLLSSLPITSVSLTTRSAVSTPRAGVLAWPVTGRITGPREEARRAGREWPLVLRMGQNPSTCDHHTLSLSTPWIPQVLGTG